MCGRFNVIDSPLVQVLMDVLGVAVMPDTRRNIAPGAKAQFVMAHETTRSLVEGYWSLLIEPKSEGKPGFRPNPRFKTFNARSDRLLSSPLWAERIRHKRAIIPATGYHEWVGKQCYQIEPVDHAIAFGGLYELWQFGEEIVPAFSIITLPGHPRLAHIHHTMPLLLAEKDFDVWLDPAFSQAEALQDLLQPDLHYPIRLTPVDSPATLRSVGEEEIVAADTGH